MPRSPAVDGFELRPVTQPSTASMIAEQLREAIAAGAFAPGDQLAETALATAFGVSRGPLREALQRLAQEGILVGRRNRGIFVIDLDDSVIDDIYLARSAIERAAVEIIIERDRARARELLTYVEAMRGDDPEQAQSADLDFHVALVRLSGSERLRRMHETLITQIRMCLNRMQPSYDDGEPKRAEEHAAVANAIIAGDTIAADVLIREHMHDGLARIRRTEAGRAADLPLVSKE